MAIVILIIILIPIIFLGFLALRLNKKNWKNNISLKSKNHTEHFANDTNQDSVETQASNSTLNVSNTWVQTSHISLSMSSYYLLFIIFFIIISIILNTNSFIETYSFSITIFVLWTITWLINRIKPKVLIYKRLCKVAPILEMVYSSSITSFRKKLKFDLLITLLFTLFFSSTSILLGIQVLTSSPNSWFTLIINSLFTILCIIQFIKMQKAISTLNHNPTQQQWIEIANSIYKTNYNSYYEKRTVTQYEDILLPVPKHYKTLQIVGSIAALLSLLICIGSIQYIYNSFIDNTSLLIGFSLGLALLLTSLILYYGIVDFIFAFSSLKKTRTS